MGTSSELTQWSGFVRTNKKSNSNNTKKVRAVLFKSEERFISFKKKIEHYDVDVTVLDFEKHKWLEFDYENIDFIIYYPSFKYSSNHPLALYAVYDNITFL